MMSAEFPDGFIIGAATAAHQVEGGNVNNNWWSLEHREGAHVEVPSGDAADSYHRWADDLDLVAGLGLNAYRFSLEWSRIEPAPGEFSRAALLHYRRMVDGAIERGLVPVVTLHHFTEPRWFWSEGGWRGDRSTERFVRYVEQVAPILQAVPWIVTINEPNMIASVLGSMFGSDPADADAAGRTVLAVPNAPLPPPDRTVAGALATAHHEARRRLRELVPAAKVGWSIANQVVRSVPGGESNADRYRDYIETAFLRESLDDDFVGVQSYTRNVFGADGPVRDDPEEERTITGWEDWPDALEHAIRDTAAIVGDVPILVTENGIATADDERRIAYTRRALAGLLRTLSNGIDVRGYLHWSLLDNYEWGSYRPTFGLVGWDPDTFERQPRPSARWLGAVAGSGRLS